MVLSGGCGGCGGMVIVLALAQPLLCRIRGLSPENSLSYDVFHNILHALEH